MVLMAYQQPVTSYINYGGHSGHSGRRMEVEIAALPPIVHSQEKYNRTPLDEGNRPTHQSKKLETIRKLMKSGRKNKVQNKSEETLKTPELDDSIRQPSMPSVQIIRPVSAESQILNRAERRSAESKTRSNGGVSGKEISVSIGGSNRRSYPPSTTMAGIKQLAPAAKETARLRREVSRSCPMLASNLDLAVLDIDEKETTPYSSKSMVQNRGRPAGLLEPIQKDNAKSKERSYGEKERVKARSKKLTSSKSFEDDANHYTPLKPPSWQTVVAQSNTNDIDEKVYDHGQVRTVDWYKLNVYPKHTDAVMHRPPKPPSWQTIPTEPEEELDAEPNLIVPDKNEVPIVSDPQPSVAPTSRAERQCQSAGSSRSTRSPNKNPPDDEDNVQDISGDLQASSSRSRGVGRSNIKRTRSRVIDAREIPEEAPVIPLSKTKHSEFQLRKTHHDNDVYLRENKQRCRQWLAGLLEEDDEFALSESDDLSRIHRASAAVNTDMDDECQVVTCDLELSRDKWMYVGSPYPSSCSEEDA